MKGLFITGTDTDIGKTFITGAIAAALKSRGYHIGVFKPLASGAIMDHTENLISEDAEFLMMAAKMDKQYRREVNEVCLAPALTPAIAAKMSGMTIDMGKIVKRLYAHAEKYSLVLVEGVGGITAPLWEDYLTADLMKTLGLPSVIVSQSGLGSINQTVLTYEYAKNRGIAVGGFVFNRYDKDNAGILEESNISYIKRLTNMILLGKMPVAEMGQMTSESLSKIAEQHLAIDHLLEIMKGNVQK